ncbi:MAG: lipid A export permease/ATP-binding protein MsbA [Pseudomonadales bacterium]|nr:lipid A export permease/ATP-binding protein MsbA [Pseudomonadales bacterium]MCP5184869.1 lipid A export permease/ATP-binding protein MsbA [Pseudomonadales bacterium]
MAESLQARARSERAGDWANYRRLLAYVRPYAGLFVLSIFGFFLASGAEGYLARLLGDLIDQWGGASVESATRIALMMFACAVARALGNIAGDLLLSSVSLHVVHNLRTQLFDHLMVLPGRFFDSSSQGHLVSRLTFTVTQLRDTGTDALKTVIQDGGKVIVYFTLMLLLSWKLTLIFVATAPLLGVVVMYASRRFRRLSRRIQSSMGDVTHIAGEAVTGYRVVKTYGGEDYERRRFHAASESNRLQNLKMLVTKVLSTEVNEVLVAAAVSGLIVLLYITGVGSEMTAGNVVTFLSLASLMARPIRKLSEVNAKLQRGLVAAEDVFSQLDQPVEKDTGTAEVNRVGGKLEFRGVSFAYARDREPVLRNINLSIEPGTTVAIVGKSGSGKSTLASLIPRFYDVTEGQILLDDKPIDAYSLRTLRNQIALVTQQITLFNDTLERNIAYGTLEGASSDRVLEALSRAHADEFIRQLPEGIATIVGDNGVLLSGGQRQRVAIARALLKDAPVLILDEATSALDSESERHIQAALTEVMRGRTTLVIAHRLSTIESADNIVVMQDGRIVETGNHGELMAAGGIYAGLHSAQFRENTPVPQGSTPVEPPRPSRLRPVRQPMVIASGSRLERAWYADAVWLNLLRPLSWAFGRFSQRRRRRLTRPGRTRSRFDAPVIVVGNITVGGTGKTPFVMALARHLGERGFSPGIVSRGYGGTLRRGVATVPPDGDPAVFGDEPVNLAQRTGLPVVIGRDRVKAVAHLLANFPCDVVLSDDGLQHYAMSRDIEIALVDGVRGFGNRRLLPAGPLREPVSRLRDVDVVVANGNMVDGATGLVDVEPVALVRWNDGERLGLDAIPAGTSVHAVCGISNPVRFRQSLEMIGLVPVLHIYQDHHVFKGPEVAFDDGLPVVITEKDAVKLRGVRAMHPRLWVLEVAAFIDDSVIERIDQLLASRGIHPRRRRSA